MQHGPYPQQPPYAPPPYGQPPYGQPPGQPPKRGPSGLVILAIIAGVGMVAVLVAVMFFFAIWQFLSPDAKTAAAPDPHTVPLTQRFATQNGLLTAHYPDDFAAKSLDHATLVVSRNFDGGEDEVVTLAAVKDPITNDPREFARLLLLVVDKNVAAKGGTSSKTSEREALCLGKYPGIEAVVTFDLPGTSPYDGKACFFLRGDKGYEVRYDVPRARAAAEVPLLERIIDATELAP
ncbi:MAG TPA: hypothetical protein VHB21_22355 [Minicystis sp.]|nr:hypothetical protein [Minicystis sp.]